MWKNIKNKIPWLLIGILILYVVFLRECKVTSDREPQVTEKTVVDSTVVDSLTKRVEYLENLPPETVRVQVEVPTEPDTVRILPDNTKIKEYTSHYKDSVISATWHLGITGNLKSQEFEYILKARPFVKETVTRRFTEYRTTTREIIHQPNPYLSVGLEAGVGYDYFSASPILQWTTSKGTSYHVKYDLINRGVLIGFKHPIRLRNISIF